MPPPKALFLTECLGLTGGALQLLALAAGLRGEGWEVSVACPGGEETHRRSLDRGLETIDLRPRQDYDVLSAVRLARLLADGGFDVLHAHHPRAHAVGLMATYLARRRPVFVVTRRVSFRPSRNPFSLLKYRSRAVDAFIAVAESVRSTLLEAGVSPERVTTIPSGVDLAVFSPRPKDPGLARELALPEGVRVVGLAAHFGPWKGHEVLLEAAARLKSRGLRAVCVFAGRETDGGRLRGLAAAAGLSEGDVRLLGRRDDMPAVLSLLDVSVSASTSGEGLSGAIRESLAMGIPVAASDVGGNGELVADGRTGRLFPAGDPAALARVLEETLLDLPAARRMAERGREAVRSRFSLDRAVADTAGLYRALLGRRAAPRREVFEHVC